MRALLHCLAVVLMIPANAAAEVWELRCPVETRGTVALIGGDDGWVATPQSSRLTGLSTEEIAGQPALACRYSLFGTSYVVWRRPPPAATQCETWHWGFRCTDS